MWELPWPWMPATPTRIPSLAPSTRPDDLVPAMVTSGNAAPAAAVWRNLRLVIRLMGYSWVRGKGKDIRYSKELPRLVRRQVEVLLTAFGLDFADQFRLHGAVPGRDLVPDFLQELGAVPVV